MITGQPLPRMTPLATAWRFLDTGCHDAAFNMAVDEALLLSHESGQSPPTLRVYTWSSPTLSLGYAQNVEKEVDGAACRRARGITRTAPHRRAGGAARSGSNVQRRHAAAAGGPRSRHHGTLPPHRPRAGSGLAPRGAGGSSRASQRPRRGAPVGVPGLLRGPVPLRVERHWQEARRQLPEARAAFPVATWLDPPVHGPAAPVRMLARAEPTAARNCSARRMPAWQR